MTSFIFWVGLFLFVVPRERRKSEAPYQPSPCNIFFFLFLSHMVNFGVNSTICLCHYSYLFLAPLLGKFTGPVETVHQNPSTVATRRRPKVKTYLNKRYPKLWKTKQRYRRQALTLFPILSLGSLLPLDPSPPEPTRPSLQRASLAAPGPLQPGNFLTG